jgi:hypothetical protein
MRDDFVLCRTLIAEPIAHAVWLSSIASTKIVLAAANGKEEGRVCPDNDT